MRKGILHPKILIRNKFPSRFNGNLCELSIESHGLTAHFDPDGDHCQFSFTCSAGYTAGAQECEKWHTRATRIVNREHLTLFN